MTENVPYGSRPSLASRTPFYASSVANQNAQDNEAATQHLKLPIQTITFERNQKALSLKPSFLENTAAELEAPMESNSIYVSNVIKKSKY